MNTFEVLLRDLLASGHRARFRATGDSMDPTIRSGEAVEIAPCDASALRRGDIVLASAARGLTLHRVVRISPRGIVMRGDNALRADAPFGAEKVLGRAVNCEEIRKNLRPFDELVSIIRIIRIAATFTRRLRSRFHRFQQVRFHRFQQ